MFKCLLPSLFCIGFYSASAQTDTDKIEALLKDVFSLKNSVSLEMNFSSSELLSSFDDLADNPALAPDYLSNLYTKLGDNPSSPILWNDMANYHKTKSEEGKALENYTKALSLTSLEFFEGDSAKFLSFRGILKFNTSDSTSTADLEDALRINPNDSMALVFYPSFLMASGEYSLAKEILEKSLSPQSSFNRFVFFQLGIADVFSIMTTVIQLDSMSSEEIERLFNRSYFDSIAQLYPEHKVEFAKSQSVFELFHLLIKAIPQMKAGFNLDFKYDMADKERISYLKQSFTAMRDAKQITPYLFNKALGFLSLMNGEFDKSEAYLMEARALFPLNKANALFQAWDVYSTLLLLSVVEKNETKELSHINRIIADQAKVGRKPDAYLLKAKYYFQNDQLELAEQICKSIHQEWPYLFENLLLYAVIKNKRGFSSMSKFFFQDAEKAIGNYEQQYKLIIVVSCVQYSKGNLPDFKSNVLLAESVFINQGFTIPIQTSWHQQLKALIN